jgi:hypothetical protein
VSSLCTHPELCSTLLPGRRQGEGARTSPLLRLFLRPFLSLFRLLQRLRLLLVALLLLLPVLSVVVRLAAAAVAVVQQGSACLSHLLGLRDGVLSLLLSHLLVSDWPCIVLYMCLCALAVVAVLSVSIRRVKCAV